eukprot:Skav223550  [mRNA]  locus=scaffold1657:363652:382223:+ [translate_table: standard]
MLLQDQLPHATQRCLHPGLREVRRICEERQLVQHRTQLQSFLTKETGGQLPPLSLSQRGQQLAQGFSCQLWRHLTVGTVEDRCQTRQSQLGLRGGLGQGHHLRKALVEPPDTWRSQELTDGNASVVLQVRRAARQDAGPI